MKRILLACAAVTWFGVAAADVVAEAGSRVRVTTDGKVDRTGFKAWRLFLYVKNAPAAFAARFADRIRPAPAKARGWETLEIRPYEWTDSPPAAFDVDTAGWPAGDYRIQMQTLVRRDGKDVYAAEPYAFTLREPVGPKRGAAGEIPYCAGRSGDPAGIADADVPWETGFSVVKTGAAPAAGTSVKVFHDGDWLYVAVRADEPDAAHLSELKRMEKVGYGTDRVFGFDRDTIEVNVDPTGRAKRFYKIIVNPTGDSIDCLGEDDNTNTERYFFTYDWRSRARIRTEVGNAGWLLEMAIPLGSMDGVAENEKGAWRFSVGRQRFVRREGRTVAENTLSCPAKGLCQATVFPVRALAALRPKAHAWDVSGVKVRYFPKDGKLAAAVSCSVYNRTGDFRLARIRASFEDRQSRETGACERPLPAESGELLRPTFEIPDAGSGESTLRFEITALGTCPEKGVWQKENVRYDPVRIVLTKPCYHDCVFASMRLDRLEGFVLMDEGLGKPFELTLSGSATEERVAFAAAAPTNRFAFAFADKATGDYFLKVGSYAKRVRNLPFKPGEVWLDADGVAYREGKKMLPYGWFSEQYRDMHPGLNVAQEYASGYNDPKAIRAKCAEAARHGCGFLVSPFQPMGSKQGAKLFGKAACQGEFGKGPNGEEQKRSLAAFIDAVRDCPGFFAYYMIDEPEGRGLNPDFFSAARVFITERDPYHPTVLLNCSESGVIRYHDGGDILAPDAYPVYCEDGGTIGQKIDSYTKAKLAASYGCGWLTVDAFDWDYGAGERRTRAPNYDQLREQHLLGLIGDARGFLLYSRHSYGTPTEYLRLGYKYVLDELTEARDVFLAPTRTDVTTVLAPEKAGVKTAVKQFGDDLVVLAVNTEPKPCSVVLQARGLPRRLHLGGEKEPVLTADETLSFELAAYESRVYRSKPWTFSPAAAREAVERAEAARRKPGNLCVAEHFLTWQDMRPHNWAKGPYAAAYPRLSASSTRKLSYDLPFTSFLQDGFADEFPYLQYHGWAPLPGDKAPWVKVDFGRKTRFGKIVLTRIRDAAGRYFLESGTVEANGATIASFEDVKGGKIELTFPPVEAEGFTVRIGRWSPSDGNLLLSEIEAY